MPRVDDKRLLDHDGAPGERGRYRSLVAPGRSGGPDAEQMLSQELVLPGVRFAVDAYVNFARRASWQEAASSSLTDLFAPQIHQSRLDAWPSTTRWIDPTGYAFPHSPGPGAARCRARVAAITPEHYQTREGQERMLEILQFKLDILWSMLDAMSMA